VSFGLGVSIALVGYIALLLCLGIYARSRGEQKTLGEFYLAGRNLGGAVLLFTLYATQYSGNTLVGYPGEAYRMGFAWIMSVGFMMAIVVGYHLVVPRLYRLARLNQFITPGDWIDFRFGSPRLSLLANVLLMIAISNYLLAQLMAMGHVVAGLSDQRIPYALGVVVLALVIIVYETLGGMRAVAWTDALQGLLLLVGLTGVLFAAAPSLSHLTATSAWIVDNVPEKAYVPETSVSLTWLSTLLLIGFSGAVYPQAIQRIYAARSARSLRRALSIMTFMPLVTSFTVFMIGIIGITRFAELGELRADQIMPMLLREWSTESTFLFVMSMFVVTGVFAAIMSTADSVLLSLSSMLAKDIVGKHLKPSASDEDLTRIGKKLSWMVMALLVAIALVPRITLWGLLELKMEILIQVGPLFMLGLGWRRLTARAAFAGMIAGTVLGAGLTLAGYGKIYGIHAGLLGALLNLAVCFSVSLLRPRSAPAPDVAHPVEA